MAKMTSLVDLLRWTDKDGNVVEEFDAKGRDFEVPDSEIKRLEGRDVLAKPGSDEAKAVKQQVAEEPPAPEPTPEP